MPAENVRGRAERSTTALRSRRPGKALRAAARAWTAAMSRTFRGGRSSVIQRAPSSSSKRTAGIGGRSAAPERGLALLDVGGEPLAGILGLEELLLQLALEGQRVLEGHLRARLHRALDEADGLARAPGGHELPRP